MVGSKRRVFKLDVDDLDDKFLVLLSKQYHDAGKQNQHSVLGAIQSCCCC